jgi:BRCT domain type II-containing protein
MGRKRRSIHSPKFAKRLKYAALRKESNPVIEEDIETETEQETNDEEIVPEVSLFNEPEPVEAKEKPKRKPQKQTTKRRTRKKAKKEVA